MHFVFLTARSKLTEIGTSVSGVMYINLAIAVRAAEIESVSNKIPDGPKQRDCRASQPVVRPCLPTL